MEQGLENKFSTLELGFEDKFSTLEQGLENKFSTLGQGIENKFSTLELGLEDKFSTLEQNLRNEIREEFKETKLILRALEHSAEVNKAEHDAMQNDLAHINGSIENIKDKMTLILSSLPPDPKARYRY